MMTSRIARATLALSLAGTIGILGGCSGGGSSSPFAASPSSLRPRGWRSFRRRTVNSQMRQPGPDLDRTSSHDPKDRRGVTRLHLPRAMNLGPRSGGSSLADLPPHTRRSKKSSAFRDPLPNSRHYRQQPEASPHLKGLL